MQHKKTLKQFFTHNYNALLPIIQAYPIGKELVVDPFAGGGHLLKLFDCRTIAIDIDPTVKPDIIANSFDALPGVGDCAIVTNPPYSYQHVLQRENPELFNIVKGAGYLDLYEYSIRRIIDQTGFCPIYAVLPENFIASRLSHLRKELYEHIEVIQIHTKSLCADTEQPTIFVKLTPDKISSTDLWIDDMRTAVIVITADGLQPKLKPTKIDYVDFGMKEGQTKEQRDTSILLKATDGGSPDNRIRLMSVSEQFPGSTHFLNKISDRAHIQIVPKPWVSLTESQIRLLKLTFNKWVDDW
ncbi:MAG: hypothetical protein WC919_03105, partial [Candidatus Paceibacterota bacterium]